MSESEGPPNKLLSIRAVSEFQDDDEALESLVQLKELDFGDVFNDRDTQLETDEGEGLAITFYHDDKYNSLDLSSGEDSDIDLSLSLIGEFVPEADGILDKIRECISDLEVMNISYYQTFDVHFNSLHLPIAEDTDHDVIGLRIEEGGKEFIIQQADEDETSVTMTWEEPEEDTDAIVSDIGAEAIEATEDFISGFN